MRKYAAMSKVWEKAWASSGWITRQILKEKNISDTNISENMTKKMIPKSNHKPYYK